MTPQNTSAQGGRIPEGAIGLTNQLNDNDSTNRPLVQARDLIFPSLDHLPGRVLGVLLTGVEITHKDAWLKFGHARLADSIWKLRKLGWPVQIHEECVRTSDAGRTASIGFYSLSREVIAAAGERGQRFIIEAAQAEEKRRAM